MKTIIIKTIADGEVRTMGITKEAGQLLEANEIDLSHLKNSKMGLLTWRCGHGYDIADSEILNGDGSGKTASKLYNEKGINFEYYCKEYSKDWQTNGIIER